MKLFSFFSGFSRGREKEKTHFPSPPKKNRRNGQGLVSGVGYNAADWSVTDTYSLAVFSKVPLLCCVFYSKKNKNRSLSFSSTPFFSSHPLSLSSTTSTTNDSPPSAPP